MHNPRSIQALLISTLAWAATSQAETWECKDVDARNWNRISIVLTTSTDLTPASVALGGEALEATYSIVGSEKRWDFSVRDIESPRQVFVIRASGDGVYDDSGMAAESDTREQTPQYQCREKRARATRASAEPSHPLPSDYADLPATDVNRRIENWKARNLLANTAIDSVPQGSNGIGAATWRNCVSLQRIGNPPYNSNERKLLLHCLNRYLPARDP